MEEAPEVRVSIPHTVVHEAKEWRPFVVFEIHFHVGDLDHVVHKRYSQLRSIHDQIEEAGPQRYVHGHGVGAIVQMGMMQIGLGAGGQRSYPFPNFPSANIFKDYSKPEHTESRKRELIGYFNCLVHHPGVLRMPHFHKHFDFTEEAVAELIKASDHIVGPRPGGGGSLFGGGGGGGSLFGGPGQPQQGGGGRVVDLMSLISQAQAQASAPTPVLRTAPPPGSIVPLNTDGPVTRVYDSEQLQQEYVLAQTVLERAQAFEQPGDDGSHHDGDRQWLGRSSVPLIYDRKMSFNITVTDSSFGDHVVSGPNGQPWFQVVRLNRVLLSFEPAQFGIFTMRGEQLMQFVVANRSPCSCDLYHVVSPIEEDASSPEPQLTALCRISRSMMTINDISEHTVETVDGTVIAHQSTHRGSVFSLNGIPAAASDRGFVLINHFGNVVMEVEAGHDVVLFVALVVCVEKMHAKQKASAAASRRP